METYVEITGLDERPAIMAPGRYGNVNRRALLPSARRAIMAPGRYGNLNLASNKPPYGECDNGTRQVWKHIFDSILLLGLSSDNGTRQVWKLEDIIEKAIEQVRDNGTRQVWKHVKEGITNIRLGSDNGTRQVWKQ